MATSKVDVVTDSDKQVLLERYLDIVWIDDVTEVKCVRCDRVPIQHYVSNCQHIFCRNCRTVFSDGGQWKCPLCHEYVTQLSDQNQPLEERIYQLTAYCPNKKYGCHYKGQLSTIRGHLSLCEATREAALPAEFKGITLDTVADQVTRINDTIEKMRSETRQLKDKCEETWKQSETKMDQLTTNNEQKELLGHVQQVQKDVKELTDKCETSWKQTQAMVDGLTTNINASVAEFQEQKKQLDNVKEKLKGVELREKSDTIEKQNMRDQLEQQQKLININTTQLEQLMNKLSSVETQVKSVMDGRDKGLETQPMTSRCEVDSNGIAQTKLPHEEIRDMTVVYEWDIRDIKTGDRFPTDTRESEVFPLTGYPYGAKAQIEFDDMVHGYHFIRLQLIDYNYHTGHPIDTRSTPKITCVVKDLSESQHNRDTNISLMFQFQDALEYEKVFYMGPLLFTTMTSPPYCVSNRMKIEVYVEPPSMARSFFSNNGILLWRLDNFKMRKQMEVDGLIECQQSPYFYTSPQGYRVLIRINLSWKTMQSELWFVKGEFDSSLTEQFPHRFTMTIINRTDQSTNLVFSKENTNTNYTMSLNQISVSSLESDGYVKDDSLLIKAAVEPL